MAVASPHCDTEDENDEIFVDAVSDFEGMKLTEDHNSKEKISELKRRKTLCVMACGLTGVGKSTLLNGLCGEDAFKVGHSTTTTVQVDIHTVEKKSYKLILCDTPGFEDETGNEDEYLDKISRKCADVDTLIYCVSLYSTRIKTKDDLATLKKLQKALNERVWNHCVIVLTFANALIEKIRYDETDAIKKMISHHEKPDEMKKSVNEHLNQEYDRRINEWKMRVLQTFGKAGIDASNMAIVEAGSAKDLLLHSTDKQPWLTTFWETVGESSPPGGAAILTHINIERISVSSSKKLSVDCPIHKQILYPRPTFITKLKDKFPTIAAALASGGAGGVVGAGVGATIGALTIGLPTFGVAAGVGLGLGAVLGGGIGVGTSVGVAAAAKKIRDKRQTQ